METNSRKEPGQQLLGLISNERDWLVEDGGGFGVAEDRKLELRLAPPGDWLLKDNTSGSSSCCSRERDEFLLSLGCVSGPPKTSNPSAGAKRGFVDTEAGAANSSGNQNQKISSQKAGVLFPSHRSSSPSPSAFQQSHQRKPAFLQFQSTPSLPVAVKESSQANGTKGEVQSHERKACSPASAPANTAVPRSSQTRTGSAPVVGWPPIRSFRKNLGSSSSKPAQQNEVPKIGENTESCKKGLFVKINMDGVPIGRKVDLKAYDSYEKLSSAVDDLFRGLLAAQRDSLASGNQNKVEENQAITGLLDGSGEYTLVYEDNEGDRMLVGDVPWDMFVSTVKRLRVFKSSEVPALCLESCKQGKTSLASGVR
ncbi:auxin-responsive protein IAA7-like [Magnolia sinica]|uniref:auxin-responsive protein IAA7-like n=1 Tax=Magnolia sinica TaxID=86752 RepID=UPI00265AAD9A|nr:auxin-responsive protein IAA7-like [Magnolia sinica]